MKKIIIILATVFISYCSNGQVIGHIENGTPTISVETSGIIQKWNDFLQSTGFTDLISSLEIRTIVEQNNTYYILTGIGSEIKSSVLLKLDIETNDLSIMSYGKKTTTCTTKGCSQTSGCETSYLGGCTPCSSDCTKSTTDASIFAK